MFDYLLIKHILTYDKKHIKTYEKVFNCILKEYILANKKRYVLHMFSDIWKNI